MKRKMISSLLAVALVSSTAGPVLGAPLKDGADGLALTLQSSKPSYTLGELVSLNIKVSNPTGQTVSLSSATDVWTGAVRVFIADAGGELKEYRGPGWGLKDVVGAPQVEIPPGGSFETAATVFYNHRPETGHLSEMYASETRGKRVATEYAFAHPGTYRLKAVLQNAEGSALESGILEIEIREPQGVDRSIWEVLRDNPDLGYFIQSGGPNGPPENPRSQQMAATLERLAGSFPEGRQAEGIRAALAEYRALLDELRGNQPPDEEPIEE